MHLSVNDHHNEAAGCLVLCSGTLRKSCWRRTKHHIISFLGCTSRFLEVDVSRCDREPVSQAFQPPLPPLYYRHPRHLQGFFKLDDESLRAVVINSALWWGWLSFAWCWVLVPLGVWSDVDIEWAQDSQPLKISLLCLYADVFLEG